MFIELYGQKLTVPDGLNEEQIRAAFAPYYPEIATAELKREGDTLKVIKRAGTKGCVSKVACPLITATPYLNPSLALALKIRYAEIQGSLSLDKILALQDDIDTALGQSKQEEEIVTRMSNHLTNARAIPNSKPAFI